MPYAGISGVLAWNTGRTSESDKAFGHAQVLTDASATQNIEGLFTLGQRTFATSVAKMYDVTLGVEAILANPWVFKLLLGNMSTTGAGPYEHTFTMANTLPTFTTKITNDALAYLRTFGNCKINSMTMTFTAGEPVRMRFEIFSSTGNMDAYSGSKISAVVESKSPYVTQGLTLLIAGGTSYRRFNTLEFTVSNNLEKVPVLQSRYPEYLVEKNFVVTGRLSGLQVDSDFLQYFYGDATAMVPQANPASVGPIEIDLQNTTPLAGGGYEQIKIYIGKTAPSTVGNGVYLNTHNMPMNPTEVINEDMDFIADSMCAWAKNDNSTMP